MMMTGMMTMTVMVMTMRMTLVSMEDIRTQTLSPPPLNIKGREKGKLENSHLYVHKTMIKSLRSRYSTASKSRI